MAFFNLTQLGPQNLFKTASNTQDGTIATSQGSGQLEGSDLVLSSGEASSSQRETTRKEVRVMASQTAPSTSKLWSSEIISRIIIMIIIAHSQYLQTQHKNWRCVGYNIIVVGRSMVYADYSYTKRLLLSDPLMMKYDILIDISKAKIINHLKLLQVT